tara:strand:+ start:193 stop:507 length:315 start_codon:yes stop_codon:yes gene_type:complete
MNLSGTGGTGLALSSQARLKSSFLQLRTAFGTAFPKGKLYKTLIKNNLIKGRSPPRRAISQFQALLTAIQVTLSSFPKMLYESVKRSPIFLITQLEKIYEKQFI